MYISFFGSFSGSSKMSPFNVTRLEVKNEREERDEREERGKMKQKEQRKKEIN